jgi:UDP-N-acetylmuramate--alanine ligase
MVHAIAKPGDFVVCLGAGTITNWAQALPGQLQQLQQAQQSPATQGARRLAGGAA